MNFLDFVDSSDDVLKPIAFMIFMSLFLYALTRRQDVVKVEVDRETFQESTPKDDVVPVEVSKILDSSELRYLKTLRKQLNGYMKSVNTMKKQLTNEEFGAIMRSYRQEVDTQQSESRQFFQRKRDEIKQKLNL